VLFDVYFVLVPEDSDFDLVPEQALVMYNARTATVPAPPGSFAIWQDYSTSSSEISAAILSAELQKKLRELVPDHFAAGGALGKHAGVSVTPAQIGALISWAKQLWNLGVFLVKFINGNPRDDDASFRVTRSATHWSGRGVDGNDYSRATMLIYRVKVGAN
jgi:hypothetical protein